MSIALLAVLALFAGQQSSASPASAQTTTPPTTAAPTTTAPPAPSAQPASPEQICRRQRIEGSRRSDRVCHTAAQWDQIRENARRNRDQASRDQDH